MLNYKYTLLLAEDNDQYRQTLLDVLSTELPDFNIHQAQNGIQVLDFLRLSHCDLILLDLSMPKLEGLEALRIIREMSLAHQPKVIAISVHTDSYSVGSAIEAGINGYLVKESSIKDILRAITIVTGGGEYFHPLVQRQYINKIASAGNPHIEGTLTPKESEVLKLLCLEYTNEEIAAELGIKVNTVIKHRQNIKTFLGGRNLIAHVKYALLNKIICEQDLLRGYSK